MSSVVIPVYNTEKYLYQCVKSVLSQEGTEKEIILIVDGSADNSPILCDRLSNEFPDIIKGIHKENKGVSVARNTGIEAASGEWIAFIDSDDCIEDGMFYAYTTVIKNYGGIILTGHKAISSDGKIGKVHGPMATASWSRGEGYSELFSSVPHNLDERAWLYFFVWNKLYKKETIEKNHIRFQSGVTYGEDFLFNASYMNLWIL